MEREKLLELLLKAPVTYSSSYLTVRELEVEGRRYRLLQRFAGSGKQRRELPKVVEVLEEGGWRKLWT
jgi:hypothetical protein